MSTARTVAGIWITRTLRITVACRCAGHPAQAPCGGRLGGPLPALLALAGCRSSDAFAGPDPLAGRPSLSPDVITLQAVIAAEQTMIRLYQAAVDGNLAADQARSLEGLLAQHRQHLGMLQARLVLPPGAPAASPTGAPARGPAG